MATSPATMALITAQFPQSKVTEFRGQTRLVIAREQMSAAFERLRHACGFDMLVDLTCVDYLNYRGASQRFGLVYLFCNTVTAERLTVRVMLDEDAPTVPSAVPVWEAANWMEREVWDLFGISFEGHPDLRRILLPEEFSAHPLRKDYPLQGRGERHNFPTLRRAEA